MQNLGLSFLIAFIYLIGFAVLIRFINTEEKLVIKPNRTNIFDLGFQLCFVIFFAIRITLAASFEGYPTDMSCWNAWGSRMNQLGASFFYDTDYFCDYPPGYLYILAVTSRISTLMGLNDAGIALMFKFPPIICDMVIYYIFFKLGRENYNSKTGLILSSVFALCPIFWEDSAVWGQIESVLILPLILSFMQLYKEKFTSSVILYVIAVLIKPQGLILAPVYLLAFIESGDIKKIWKAILSGVILFIVICMPFSTAWREYQGIDAFIRAINPIWVIGKYITTLSSYAYFSVNAFNFWAMLGLNWVSIAQPQTELLYQILNIAIMVLGVLGTIYLYIKIKDRGSKLCLCAYFIFIFLYTFAFKMHERYIIVPIIFLLLEFIYSKNKKILWLFCGFSINGFINLFYILRLGRTEITMPDNRLAIPLGLIQVILFLVSLWVIYNDYFKTKKRSSSSTGVLEILENSKTFGKFMVRITGFENKNITSKMIKIDYIILTVIVLIYSSFAFTNLGDTKAPQTYFKPTSVNEEFIIEFEDTPTISEIDYYCGIGDVDTNPGIDFSYSQDGINWTDMAETYCKLNSVFKWEYNTFDPITAKYLKGVAQSDDYMLFEIGFRDSNGYLIDIDSVVGEASSNCPAMADEQQFVTDAPSYENGTYFDEIYHPRTAYEHLHMMPYYETTHPPLGKLMMSLGLMMFGMTPFGWRCVGAFMGVLMLPIFYLFLKKMFKRTRYATFGTLLFAFDFMHFSLTRIGTIDSYPVFFIICMYYFMYTFGESALKWAKGENISYRKLMMPLFIGGISMGLGCASKWTAVYASVGLAIEFFIIMFMAYKNSKNTPGRNFIKFFVYTCLLCIPFFIIIPGIIYTLSYLPISMVEGYGNVFETMWNNQEYMLAYHSELGGTHPYSSKWYTWPFVYRPMWAYQAPEVSIMPDQIGCISIFQNPLLSWLGICALIYSLFIGVLKKDKRVLFLVVGFLAQYVSWIFVKRYALQYHFFASMPFIILFVIYAIADLEKRFKRFGYISVSIVAVCLLMFLMFYPVISGVPTTRFYADTFLTWFNSWVFFI